MDGKFQVFGSKHHRYRLGPPLSERELAEFEFSKGVRLPEDYRQFLANVGNGGAGPYYGLESLHPQLRDLSQPFPLVAASDTLSEEALDRLPDPDDYPGVLELCHMGCGHYAYLVVNGPKYGMIWYGGEGLYFPTEFTFSSWYRRWLEKSLVRLANQPLVGKLRIGMSRDKVVAEVGGDWKVRVVGQNPTYLFECSDIPVQLEVDASGIVVKVNPWPFIF